MIKLIRNKEFICNKTYIWNLPLRGKTFTIGFKSGETKVYKDWKQKIVSEKIENIKKTGYNKIYIPLDIMSEDWYYWIERKTKW